MNKINIHWFRRDLRIKDNAALWHALSSDQPVLPIFIFDNNITRELPSDDARITFIYDKLRKINDELSAVGSGIRIYQGQPLDIFQELLKEFTVNIVFTNHDYEPYAIQRDQEVIEFLSSHGVSFKTFKDQVIFEKDEILKKDLSPYTVFTPYKNQWISKFKQEDVKSFASELKLNRLFQADQSFPELLKLGFSHSPIQVFPYDLSVMNTYHLNRDIPSENGTSYLGPHLRFGTVSIREMVNMAAIQNPAFLNELIWREFFMQIMYHFPDVILNNFKRKYDAIHWINNENDFEKWKLGETGYPIVDAGMKQLNETGYMHNRVRMVTASFLCKHLLIDWRWGEAYFAKKLLDFELSSNNGNWQWAAGTGCDAAPYFRVFNPITQQQRFDPQWHYISKWIPDFKPHTYISPIVDHAFARQRAIDSYKKAIS